MMMRYACLIAAAVGLSACDTRSGFERANGFETVVDGVRVSIRESPLAKAPSHPQLPSGGNKHAMVIFQDSERNQTRARAVRLTEAAFAQHPDCAWVGYDPAYDLQARLGAAETNDNRLLFVAMEC